MRVVVCDARVPVAGALLATDVTVAEDQDPMPALLIRTPYSRAAARDMYDVVGLARDGWAVVVQDARGRFDSSGRFEPFSQESADGADSIAWCASQPWCDGTVAMEGMSYLGWAQWAAARASAGRARSALRAINPVLAPSEPPELWLAEGGAFAVALAQTWALGVVASSTDAGSTQDDRTDAGRLAGDWRDTMRSPAVDDPVSRLLPAYGRWRAAAHRPQTARSHGPRPAPVPVFQVAGWYDPFCESGLRAHSAQVDSGVPVMTVVGPWAHNERLSNLYPELDFGPLANGDMAGVANEGLRWMRSVISGLDVPTGVRYFVMGAGEWRSTPTWPPPSRTLRLFLDEGGILSSQPPASGGCRTLRHDPSDPVPTWGGRNFGPYLPVAGPADQRPVEAREDVALWTSPVLERSVTIAGRIAAELSFESTASPADLALTLSDVHPDGRSFNVVDALARLHPSGKPKTMIVGSAAHRFLEGHRIRLRIAPSSFPRYDLNPAGAFDLRLYWGASSGHLVLPEV